LSLSTRRLVCSAVLMVWLLPLSLSFLIRNAQAAQTVQTVLYPTDDAYIDSSNAGSNYGTSTALATLSYSAYLGLSTRYMQSWLKFDLSGIPPAASITTATLTLHSSYARVYAIVGVYSASNSWSESSITWNSAPRGSISGSYSDTQYVTNSTTTYNWSVSSLVSGIQGVGSVTLVLQPTSSQSSNSNGYAVYYSKEAGGSLSPSLSITYSYVSSSLSLSSSPIQYGSSVPVTGNTDPVQSGGTTTLQYSTDQSSWNNIASQTGGTYTFSWTPASAGTYYLRSSWTITWSGGSYTANSANSQLTVTRAPSSLQVSVTPTSTSRLGTVSITASLTPPLSDGTITLQHRSSHVESNLRRHSVVRSLLR